MGAKIDAQKKLFFENNKHKKELKNMYHPTDLLSVIDLRNKTAANKSNDSLKILKDPETALKRGDLLEERAARDMLEEITNSNIRRLYHQAKKTLVSLVCSKDKPFSCDNHDVMVCSKDKPFSCDNHDVMKKHLRVIHSDMVMNLTADVRDKLYYVNFMNDDFASYGQGYEKSASSDMVSPHQKSWIDCEPKQAEYLIKELSKLPKAHFLKCYTTCTVNGQSCLATEHYKEACPVPAHLRTPVIRHLVSLSAELDSMGIVHANFDKKTLVEVNHKPKHYCLPALPAENLFDLKILGDSMAEQRKQICKLMDHLVGESELTNPTYQNFRKYFLKSNTLDDFESLFFHPYITEPYLLPFYHANCCVIQSCNREVVNHSAELDRKFGDALGYREWTSRIENTRLEGMLTSRKDPITGQPREYLECPSHNHKFIWNATRHVDDIDVQYESVEEIHVELAQSFSGYVQEIFEYNHEIGLNSHFGPESNDLDIFKHARAIAVVTPEDNSFSIPNLIVTCNKIIRMLAKFHYMCTNEDAKSSVEAATQVLERFIQNFETFHEEHLKCTLAHNLDDMTDTNKLLLTTICLVHGALGIVSSLLEDYECTVECLERATELVINGFPMLRDIIQISNLFNFEAVNWPDIKDLKKIAGTNFILQQKERNRIKSDINTFLKMLKGMVVGEKV